jgi:hypothetical protein
VSDFGLSVRNREKTLRDQTQGTVAYMAPEVGWQHRRSTDAVPVQYPPPYPRGTPVSTPALR